VGTEIAGMDFRGLQPAAGGIRSVVFDFRHSEILNISNAVAITAIYILKVGGDG
jgi:hypothetical protein